MAITLYKSRRGEYNYRIEEMTGHTESTINIIVKNVCQAIVELHWEDAVTKHFPKSDEEFCQALIDMKSEWQFKFASSTIDGSHIPIKYPSGGPEAIKEYHNFKKFYSVVLMALVDAKYRFIWAAVGAPDNIHDSIYFQSTNLFQELNDGYALLAKYQVINNTMIPPMILGDGAFLLKPWLCKPYGDVVLTE